MSTELESAKYFSPDYFQNTATGADATTTAGQAADLAALPMAHDPNNLEYEVVPWPVALTIVLAIFTVLGGSGLIGGLYAAKGVADLEMAGILVDRLADQLPEAQMMKAMMAAQVENSAFLYVECAVRILTGIGFLLVAGIMGKRTPFSNKLGILICSAAIFYNMVHLGVTWMTTSSMMDAMAGSDQFAGMGSSIVLLFAGGFFLFKTAIYCGIMFYLSRPGIERIFLPKPKRSLGY